MTWSSEKKSASRRSGRFNILRRSKKSGRTI